MNEVQKSSHEMFDRKNCLIFQMGQINPLGKNEIFLKKHVITGKTVEASAIFHLCGPIVLKVRQSREILATLKTNYKNYSFVKIGMGRFDPCCRLRVN